MKVDESKIPKVGDFSINKVTYTTEMVQLFAELVGDKNPIHLNKSFAESTFFKRPLVHGIMVAGQISKLIASDLPGPGSIYIHQDLKFISPVYHFDTIICRTEVIVVKIEKSIVVLNSKLINQNGKTVLEGNSVVKIL
jgi:acyl dehydratase